MCLYVLFFKKNKQTEVKKESKKKYKIEHPINW